MTVEQIIRQMQEYTATWRAQGVTQVPLAWLDYWSQQLAVAERPYRPYAPSYGPLTVEPFWMPGLPLRQAGTFNIEVNRGFTLFR
jgi:hypothetical protein